MKRKDWPNLQRMFIALILLIISPLVGIAAGAVFWRSLERGLLVFNLLGLLGFALVTRPYWTGNRPRIRKLLMSGFAMGVSALLDIVTGRPVPLAVYFSSMVECFSLIPWITEILNEIHQGQWRSPSPAGPSAPAPYAHRGKTATPDLWNPSAEKRSQPGRAAFERTPPSERTGPELPTPGIPRWLLLPAVAALILLIGLLLWSAATEAPPEKPLRDAVGAVEIWDGTGLSNI